MPECQIWEISLAHDILNNYEFDKVTRLITETVPSRSNVTIGRGTKRENESYFERKGTGLVADTVIILKRKYAV